MLQAGLKKEQPDVAASSGAEMRSVRDKMSAASFVM